MKFAAWKCGEERTDYARTAHAVCLSVSVFLLEELVWYLYGTFPSSASVHFDQISLHSLQYAFHFEVCFVEAFFFSLSHDHLADTFILYLQCTRRLGPKYNYIPQELHPSTRRFMPIDIKTRSVLHNYAFNECLVKYSGNAV